MISQVLTQGTALTCWLFAGPYSTDVSHLYTDSYDVPLSPYQQFFDAADATVAQLASETLREGEELRFRSIEKTWTLRRFAPGENKFMLSGGGAFARTLQTFACTEIVSPAERMENFLLALTGSADVWLNGEKIFSHHSLGRVASTSAVTVRLKVGVNRLLIVLTNAHVHAVNSFELVWQGGRVEARLPLAKIAERETLEKWFVSLHFPDSLLLANDPARDVLSLRGNKPPDSAKNGKLTARFYAKNAAQLENPVLLTREFFPSEETVLIRAGELPRGGQCTVTFDYTSDAGDRLADVAQLVFWRANMDATPDTNDIVARKAWLLQRTAQLARTSATKNIREWFFIELSRLATGGNFPDQNQENFNAALDYIDRRFDCADFSMHGLLRLFYLHRDNPDFLDTTRARLKQTILNFKYWEDEPGATMMFTRSENHQILFHSAEFLAGQLFPDATFSNNGMSGAQHVEKGARLANEWMFDRTKHGFEEWFSNTYFEEDLLAMLNLFQFAPDGSETKKLAGGLLDLLTFILASHHFHGTLATTHGRAYEQSILHPELEALRPIIWLLFGQPKSLNQSCSIGAVALATGAYAPSPAVLEMAMDTAPLATRSRMGSFVWNPEAKGGINCLTKRRDDYMVSGMVEARLGPFNAQAHAGQITLKGGVPVFVSCFDNPGPDARPSYWGGQFRVPKTIVSGDILAYIYDIPDVSGLTHCYFPRSDFDEVAEAGRWLCGRKGDAYIGVYSLKKYVATNDGAWKDRELLCGEKRNIWILQAGSRDDYGSFEQFRTALRDAKITIVGGDGESVRYVAPRNGELFLSHRETCTRDGVPVLAKPFPMLENPRGRADYGEGQGFHLTP